MLAGRLLAGISCCVWHASRRRRRPRTLVHPRPRRRVLGPRSHHGAGCDHQATDDIVECMGLLRGLPS
jgi:hypothetical protein